MSTVTDVASTTSSTSSTSTSTLSSSYDAFLQLLCAELENQNPLDPLDSTEFVTQLAQYSALEQQISTNDKLAEVLTALDSFSSSSAVSYIGLTVEAESDSVTVDAGEGATFVYELDAAADEVEITIEDADGNTVWSGSGETASGRHTLEWDGLDEDGNAVPAGTYTITVNATDSSGNAIDTATYLKGTVTGVDTSSGSTVLEIDGGAEVDVDDVVRVTA